MSSEEGDEVTGGPLVPNDRRDRTLVKVGVGARGHVVVDDDVHALDIDASSDEIGGDEDALIAILEGL